MTSKFRVPDAARGHGGTVAALGAVTIPVLVVALLAPKARDWLAMANVSSIIAYIAALFSVILIYLHWRSSGGPLGWLILGVTALTVQAGAMVGMIAAQPTKVETHQGWIALGQAGLALGMITLVILSAHRPLRANPLSLGVAVGLLVVGARFALVTATQPMDLWSEDAARVVVTVVYVVVVASLWRLAVAPDWLRPRLVIGWALLAIAHVLRYPASSGDLLSFMTVLLNIVGATILLVIAISLLRLTVVVNREEFEATRVKLEKVEAEARADAERLHEIRATIAGLTSASRLIHQDNGIADDRRHQIEDMIDSEMDRLLRLLNDETTAPPRPIEVDKVIQPLVLRHRLRGFQVDWRPSGERVLARGDQVAEVINVLLENAYQHAAGAGASVYTRRVDDVIEIAVADSGPGVDRSVRPRMFELGERSKESSGNGIGLSVAKKLTGELGGYLKLVDSPAALGATFVLGLPAEERP